MTNTQGYRFLQHFQLIMHSEFVFRVSQVHVSHFSSQSKTLKMKWQQLLRSTLSSMSNVYYCVRCCYVQHMALFFQKRNVFNLSQVWYLYNIYKKHACIWMQSCVKISKQLVNNFRKFRFCTNEHLHFYLYGWRSDKTFLSLAF